MKRRGTLLKAVFSALVLFMGGPRAQAGPSGELSLREALNRSIAFNPTLKAATERMEAAEARTEVSQSAYLPSVDLEAVDGSGFPGSTGATLGMTGIVGSPYRSGASAGVVLTENLYDFGRTGSAVKTTKIEAQIESNRAQVDVGHVEQQVISAYFDCALHRTNSESWKELLQDALLVSKQVESFVKSGQRSIVDRYLSLAAVENARTQVADFEARESSSVRQIMLLIGSADEVACPSLSQLSDDFGLRAPAAENPVLAVARLRKEAAQARLEGAKAENYPLITGMASVGYLQDTYDANSDRYSVGVGIKLPLFEGFRIQSQVKEAAAAATALDFQAQSSELDLRSVDRQYDERIDSASVRRKHLDQELEIAQKALQVAEKRYFSMQGTLVDLRDSVTNLERVVSGRNAAHAEYLKYTALKAVLNGAR